MNSNKDRIRFFRELLSTVNSICYTELDERFDTVYTDAEDFSLYSMFFAIDNAPEKTKVLAATGIQDDAANDLVIYTNSVGMAWLSNTESMEDGHCHVHMLGPVFLDDFSEKAMEKGMDNLQLSIKQRHAFLEIIRALPIVNISRFYEYGIMLHYCVTGEKIGIGDIVHAEVSDPMDITELEKTDRHGNYLAEQKILKMVEEGNLKYKEEFEKTAASGAPIKLSDKGALNSARNSVMMFTTLVSRAAIRGGLFSDVAYTLCEIYFKKADNANNIATLTEISHDMLDDFVHRVHRIHNNGNNRMDPVIRDACDYIALHINENIELHDIANRLGYTDYYFSNKFKKETGISFKDYVTRKKLDSAKEELLHTNNSVQDIAANLGYNEHSYFSYVFKKIEGMSPQEFRETKNLK